MPLDFPLSPAPNQVYSLGGKSWKWNGDAWETYNDNLGVDFVETVNGVTGDVGVVGGTDISVSTAGKTLTINYTGSSVSNAVTSFNGRTGAVQGVSSANGLTGAVLFRSGQGITHSTSGGGISFGLNYLNGGSPMTATKNPAKGDWIAIQKSISPFNMERTQLGNLSYLLLGSASSGASGASLRLARDIDGGNSTVTDEYISFESFRSEVVSGAVQSFNGLTGDVQGVSAINGFTGGFEIRPGRGITHSYSNNGISFEINYTRGTGVFPGKSAGGMAYTDIMLFQEKPSGGNTGAMYTANIQNFYDRFIAPNIPPKPSAAELAESPNNSFLMVNLAGNEGFVPFADQMSVISQNLTVVDGGSYT